MTTAPDRDGFRVNVLNPGGRDPEQHFADDPSGIAGAHPPVNFHAYAACTGGSFFRETKRAIASGDPVLLLLRGDFRAALRALRELRKANITVAVSLKETGLHQIAGQLREASKLARFSEILREADGGVASTSEAADFYRALRHREGVEFIPTPYPIDDPEWNFARPIEERRGIFIGTREWDVPSRNHLAALAIARTLDEPTTVFNDDGRTGDRLLGALAFPRGRLTVHHRRVPYRDYLRMIAQHKIVLQLDSSFVPGQVAGDALLGRLPCVGGNGAIDRIGHPGTNGYERSLDQIRVLAAELLRKPASVTPPPILSFAAGAKRLREYFALRQTIR